MFPHDRYWLLSRTIAPSFSTAYPQRRLADFAVSGKGLPRKSAHVNSGFSPSRNQMPPQYPDCSIAARQASLKLALCRCRQIVIARTLGISPAHKRYTSGVQARRCSGVPMANAELIEHTVSMVARTAAALHLEGNDVKDLAPMAIPFGFAGAPTSTASRLPDRRNNFWQM
jgi:hypothetical protein